MDLNLTNLKDLEYICQIAADHFDRSLETEWLERTIQYRRLIRGEIDCIEAEYDAHLLVIDPLRPNRQTGIFVRAISSDGKFHSVDVSELTRDSLFAWLRSRGGNNQWAENTVALLLGHKVSED